ncbi:MAG: DVU0298 family protein [Thermodesulfobacteriota bacterium]
MRERALKKNIIALLNSGDLAGMLALQETYPRYKLVNPLIGCLCNTDEMIKWLAVSALGQIVAGVATADMESGRVVMRRFMWMLNDESGGIGWGVPEAMAEVMACHAGLAAEYAHILVANMREEGNFLELPMLQRGLMWGLGRLAGARPALMKKKNTAKYLGQYLDSDDPEVRGRAIWAMDQLGDLKPAGLTPLLHDNALVTIYQDQQIKSYTVGELAKTVLR